jgi:hypothetical protein
VTAVTVETVVRTIIKPLHKKITPPLFLKKNNLEVQFGTFGNRCDVLRAAICDSRNVFWRGRAIFFEESLHDFFVVERLRDFCVERLCDVLVWRGCVIFSLTHKGA